MKEDKVGYDGPQDPSVYQLEQGTMRCTDVALTEQGGGGGGTEMDDMKRGAEYWKRKAASYQFRSTF
ncbi:unnamed protein product [Enterobius vermicularis]|uniref:Uncharacterized protein n=1 Tax=Enterobius vermicularis TaxID=51028 RepID=A0A0N4VPZ2_ENTVE|nr:unnamed protein product [Enterobius vermicularis]